MSTYVFTGPTLSPEDARKELDAIYLPPVSQGDIIRIAQSRPRAIGIIDGYFENVPAVWHKEILHAISQGTAVYGSASMGALRAAELASFGMKGVGAVYKAFHDGILEDDDEVAVIHGPVELGYPVLSEAMVNIRKTLSNALADGVISNATSICLEGIAKNLRYQERTYFKILEHEGITDLPEDELEKFKSWLPGGRADQKREDALLMLRLMREHLENPDHRKSVQFHFEHTTHWENAFRQATLNYPT